MQGDAIGAESVIGDGDIGHLDAATGVGVLRQGGDGVGECNRRGRLVYIGDSKAVGGADRAGATDRGVAHRNGDGIGRFGLVVEAGTSLEEESRAIQLKGSGIGALQGDGVAAESVIGDGDIGQLDAAARVGVLRQGGSEVGERNSRRRLVHIGDSQAVLGAHGTGTADGAVAHHNGDGVGRLALVIQAGAGLEIEDGALHLKGSGIGAL